MTKPTYNDPLLNKLIKQLATLVDIETDIRVAIYLDGPGTRRRKSNEIAKGAIKRLRVTSEELVNDSARHGSCANAIRHLQRFVDGISRMNNLDAASDLVRHTRRYTHRMVDEVASSLGIKVSSLQIMAEIASKTLLHEVAADTLAMLDLPSGLDLAKR